MEVSQIHEAANTAEQVRGWEDIGAEEWEKIFEEQKASGKSIKQWCKENHINTYAYYRRQKEQGVSTRQEKCRKTVELVKIVIEQQRGSLPTEEDTALKTQSIMIFEEGGFQQSLIPRIQKRRADALPFGSIGVRRRQQWSHWWLVRYADDQNNDGITIVQVNNYTWSANASLTEMNSQMAGATQMNTDLANGDSKIWIIDDPAGFEQAYGALSENLSENWHDKLIAWSEQPALASLELGSYATTADGTQTQDIQQHLADFSVAVFDESSALWQNLNKQDNS